MKFLIVLSALLIVALAEERQDIHGFGPAHEKCQTDSATHIDDATLEKLRTLNENDSSQKVEHTEQMDKHQVCMAKAMNMMNEDGKVNSEGIATHVRHTISDEAKITEIAQKCAKDEETPEKTAAHLMKCMAKNHVFHSHHSHDHSHEDSHDHSH